jgi:hypothetical protein
MDPMEKWSKTTDEIQNGSGGLTLTPLKFRALPLSDAIIFRIGVWWPLDEKTYHGFAKVQNDMCYVYYDDGDIRRYTVMDMLERKVRFHRTILNTPEETPIRRGFSIPIQCSLCLTQIECPSRIVACKHTFCGSCLQKSLWISSICPMCRGPIDACRLMSYDDTLKWTKVHRRLEISAKEEQAIIRILADERAQTEKTMSARQRELNSQIKTLVSQRQQITELSAKKLLEIDEKRKEAIANGQKAREKMKADLLFRELTLNF